MDRGTVTAGEGGLRSDDFALFTQFFTSKGNVKLKERNGTETPNTCLFFISPFTSFSHPIPHFFSLP